MRIGRILYRAFVIANLTIAISFACYTVVQAAHSPIDFPVFYGAAQNALHGVSIYTSYSIHNFPFWYFPWVSWIFIPLAIFSYNVAWIIYLVVGFSIAFLSVNALANHFKRFGVFDRLFMFTMLIWMSWQAYRVGQLSYLLLGAVALTLFLVEKKRFILVGLCMPLLLIKPHLFIIFIPLALWLGGKKTLIASALITFVLLGIETLITPDWIQQMIHLLMAGTQRYDASPFWDFSTLATLLGFPQNYAGTGNLPFTLALAAIGALVVIRFRSLPKIPLMSLALAASLFCAPRTYAYDLVLLIPAMIWLSEKWSFRTALLWLVCAAIPFVSHFSSGSYLVTLIVFTLSIAKAYKVEKESGIVRTFLGMRKNALTR